MKKLTLQEFCNTFDCYGCVDSDGRPYINDTKPYVKGNMWQEGEGFPLLRLRGLEQLIKVDNPIVEEAHDCPNCGNFIEETRYWELHWRESLTKPKGANE